MSFLHKRDATHNILLIWAWGSFIIIIENRVFYLLHFNWDCLCSCTIFNVIVQLFIHCNSQNYKLSEEIVKREDVDVNSIVRV